MRADEASRTIAAGIDVSDDPAFADTMTMTWTLEALRRGTRVTVRATDVPAGITPEDHREGLASSLDNLAAAAEQTQ